MPDAMNEVPAFLSGGGEMGALMRNHDWAATPFGPVECWPQSLRSMVGACLNSPLLGTVLWGPELRMLYNDAYVASMADRHPAAIGRPIAEVWGEVWDLVAPPFEHAMRTGEGFAQDRVELPMVRNGQPEITYWNISATPIVGEDGSIVGLLNQGIEITGQVVAEQQRLVAKQQLRDMNEQLAQEVAIRTEERNLMWDTSPDLMVVINFEGIFQRVNPAWTTLLGYQPEELIGHHINEFITEEDHLRTVDAYLTTAGGKQVRIVNRYRHKNGAHHWISWVAAPAGDKTYATGRDITEEIERQAQLESTHEQLRQAQKMEAVGQLTGGLAHDFNNLLAGISVSLEMIEARIRQDRTGEVSKYLLVAQGATKRAAALTHRLLAFSRRQTLAPKAINAGRLVSGMLDMVQRTVGPNIVVESYCTADLWTARVDPSQLENALLNLCLNARDAMPEGGRITVETGNRVFDAESARQQDIPEGEYLAIRVTDSGTGMSPEVLTKAFDPFFTTKPMGEGTGLGLSMIHGFTQQSGGQVRIHSQLGIGTTVSLYLPRYTGTAERDNGPLGLAPVLPAQRGETVLVVDDEPTVRLLITDLLADLGYRAIVVADGVAALEVLQSGEHLDLLLTDVGLPGGMNGLQLANAGRLARPDLRVLFITGYAENALFHNGLLEPGMSVLSKPFSVNSLAERMRELIGQPPALHG
ncbi:hybrid sensor histidine kinase/response regulator [Stutzerimonas stutzeri]|jgi:PAS domain S-box-containing protein|uniref:histidine kinase n=1 Tax=Stutzerimonas stutzeri TaxID=316 RepID=A0A5S5BCK1_STUST|nr:PAS domain-containing sensor histidine kinase [Stutzerimonas stutzeri]TYP64188.1 PAS/PAC sensor hybrid histidine kinase [Stutzerimonas stutzeri]